MIDILLYSHHLPAWYCIDTVRRNSVLVTCGSERVKFWKEVFIVLLVLSLEICLDSLLALSRCKTAKTFWGCYFNVYYYYYYYYCYYYYYWCYYNYSILCNSSSIVTGTYLLIISPPIRAIWYKVFEKFKSSVIMIRVISLKSEQMSWP